MATPKKLTEAELKRVFNVWTHRLNLSHWEFTLEVDAELEDNDADISIPPDYHHATVRFDVSWRTWDQKEVNEVVCHELHHVHFHQIVEAALMAKDGFGAHAWHLYERRLIHEVEAAVDVLAVNLVQKLGYA